MTCNYQVFLGGKSFKMCQLKHNYFHPKVGINSFTGTENFEVLKHFTQVQLMSSCYLLDTIQWTGNMEMNKTCFFIKVFLHEDTVFWLSRHSMQAKRTREIPVYPECYAGI